jgi:hypothetical protein
MVAQENKRRLKKAAPILAAISLAVCSCLFRLKATAASQDGLIGDSSFSSSTVPDDRGAVTADLNDSDEFFQNAIRTRGRMPDYSRKIESFLKQMTVAEKVGQMTQLTREMIVSGHDQNIQIDPASCVHWHRQQTSHRTRRL